METPWSCARVIAEFLNKKIEEYDEKELATGKAYGVYAGFLPREDKAEKMKELCPAIVIRPLMVVDGEEHTVAKMVIYVVVFDQKKAVGCTSLYHLLEFIRFQLLTNNPINEQYKIKLKGEDAMETFIPDDQPFPFWEGRIDFAVYLEQPSNTKYIENFNNKWKR